MDRYSSEFLHKVFKSPEAMTSEENVNLELEERENRYFQSFVFGRVFNAQEAKHFVSTVAAANATDSQDIIEIENIQHWLDMYHS